MAVLNRKLFNRGGHVSSRGVGITSGLVPRYSHGGPVSEHTSVTDKFADNMEMLKGLDIIPERKPFDRAGANREALMTLFGNLMAGKSYQGGLGGALEIAGKSLTAAAPQFGEALAERRAYEAADPEASLKQMALQMALKKDDPRYEYKVSDGNVYKIDTTGVEDPVITSGPAKPKKLQGEPNLVFGKFDGIDDPTYAQEFVFNDGSSEYRIGGATYTTFEPRATPKDGKTPITYEEVLPNNKLQSFISFDNGDTFAKNGVPYDKFKPDKADKPALWTYSKTIDNVITKTDGKKYKQTYALYNKEGVTDPKKTMIFEELVPAEGQESLVRKSGNIVFKDGDNKGDRRAAMEFKDGITRYYDPSDDNAAIDGAYKGFVDVKDKFEFFTTGVTGDPDTIFGSTNAEKFAIDAANTAGTLATGADLINQALTLGNDINSLNRTILDKGGKILSQIPIIGDDMKSGLYEAFDADPKQLQKFITNSRIFVAQSISTITGEGSARVSEPERELANEALALLQGITDSESAIAAIQAANMAAYVTQHRQLMVAGAQTPSLYDANGKQQFNEQGAVYHANILKAKFNLNKQDIMSVLTRMRNMEQLGLAQLTTITTNHSNYFKDKAKIQQQYAALLPPVEE